MGKRRPERAERKGSAGAGRQTGGPGARPGRAGANTRSGLQRWLALGGAALVVAVAAIAIALGSGSNPAATQGGTPAGSIVQATGGSWTSITADTLASMLEHKDFTLLNVKTPYVGEIAGTDLYIPYDQLQARASELPRDKSARIVVYCRTGHESAIAAQTLLDLGYTNIDNLDGGMTAWTASGRQLVQLNRSGG